MGTIIPVEKISELGNIITNYENIVISMSKTMISNNIKFCEEFEKIVKSIKD